MKLVENRSLTNDDYDLLTVLKKSGQLHLPHGLEFQSLLIKKMYESYAKEISERYKCGARMYVAKNRSWTFVKRNSEFGGSFVSRTNLFATVVNPKESSASRRQADRVIFLDKKSCASSKRNTTYQTRRNLNFDRLVIQLRAVSRASTNATKIVQKHFGLRPTLNVPLTAIEIDAFADVAATRKMRVPHEPSLSAKWKNKTDIKNKIVHFL